MFDEIIPVRTVRAHCMDKSWMTPNIKALVKARQRAFTKGKTSKYESLHAKVTKLISNAKVTYYKSKDEGATNQIPPNGINRFTHINQFIHNGINRYLSTYVLA
jgi:hypothetical protein